MTEFEQEAGPAALAEPQLSLVMPCYNEEENVGYTIPKLLQAFEREGHRVELVAVNNGSRDHTGEKLARLAREHPEVVVVTIERNEGFGNGILAGLTRSRSPWIGTVAADGQVDAEDVVRLYEAVSATDGWVVGKVRRRFRMDGPVRKVISVGYNVFVHLLWPGIGSWDVNGQPRVYSREVMRALQLTSTNWFIDPEMLIKAHYLGVRIFEVNVFARMRGNGLSHVRATTVLEFFTSLVRHRLSGELKRWRREGPRTGMLRATPARSDVGVRGDVAR